MLIDRSNVYGPPKGLMLPLVPPARVAELQKSVYSVGVEQKGGQVARITHIPAYCSRVSHTGQPGDGMDNELSIKVSW